MAEGRRRYPTRNGLPIMPLGIEECYDECPKNVSRTNKHHLAFNRAMYKTPVERAYREAGCMAVQACICKHANLHATYTPPPVPNIHLMHDVVQGDIVPAVEEVFIRRKDG